MAGSYSTDLRERVLAAMEAGETPEVAARTGVRVHPWTVGRALRRCGWT